ncbi:LPS translocon maturation chaperone LptM [Niveibacterium microcysteis]|uniref:Lipoprotein n=1 Tax=Niveibacterium microcysteis TaxID=2811415 RepID=A0ABX7M4V4_9RHOO|nr:lipoprotein [Niveibacterium microcysteis]QSI76777.1 lipoprotein [Niveibacterium microcysteis]
MLYRLHRALLCSAVLLLAACGIKGPLYLPAPVAQPAPPPATQSAPVQPAADGSKSPAPIAP